MDYWECDKTYVHCPFIEVFVRMSWRRGCDVRTSMFSVRK